MYSAYVELKEQESSLCEMEVQSTLVNLKAVREVKIRIKRTEL